MIQIHRLLGFEDLAIVGLTQEGYIKKSFLDN